MKATVALLLLSTLSFLPMSSLPAESEKNDPTLTLERLFEKGAFASEAFDAPQWTEGESSFTRWEGEKGKSRHLVLHHPEDGSRLVLVGEDDLRPSLEDDPLKVDSYQLSADRSKLLIYTNSKRVWRRKTRGDYWVYDISGRSLHQLGGPDAAPSSLMFAELSPDGENVCYVWENNLYVEDLRGGHIRALTSDGSETLINGTFDWVYEEELGLRKGFRWSPDSAHLAFWQLNTEGVRIFHLINNTDSLYPELIPIPYPKVGERNATARIGVLSIKENKPPVWIDMPGDPREHYLSHLNWIEGPDQLVIRQLNRLQNTARVFLADPASGEAESLFTDQDEAWVDTPPQIWIDHDTAFLWQSERDGWRHVYRVSRDGNEVQLVTPGDFDVTSIAGVDEKNDHLYFMASPDDATCRYLYRINLDGTGQVRVTPEGRTGVHRYQLDPTCRWAVHRFSNMATPPVADLIKIDGHETIEALSKNEKLKKEIAALAIAEPEFFQIEIEDGTRLDGWCLKPQNMDTGKKHPILFRVYGEPAGQTVMNQWSGKRHLWHLMLTQQGYVVISVDNRGTPAPRGRDWRKSVYRQVGILASADQAAATRALLKERPYLDEKRVGIWGESGGGSMTLNALFRYPELYHTGIAISAVSNQRFYDTIYQERYMGLPGDNVEGYKNGSPITYAHQLKGNLLIIHGTADDNVHYQSAESLINELIKLDKDFDFMPYPNRTHSLNQGKNTTRHFFRLLTRFLHRHLPAGDS